MRGFGFSGVFLSVFFFSPNFALLYAPAPFFLSDLDTTKKDEENNPNQANTADAKSRAAD
jgi:hypothetical protein